VARQIAGKENDMEYRFEFGVIADDDGETLFSFVVKAADDAEAARLWSDLLDVLPAGRVGGGFFLESAKGNIVEVSPASPEELYRNFLIEADDEEDKTWQQ
jgi:hypothetical protein